VRRSELPIKYSEGFNPHQIMSFAAPLGVGITSDGEYMDIELKEAVPSKEGLERLQKTMVEGMEILQFKYLPEGAKNAMSSVTAAGYTLTYKKPEEFPFSLEELKRQKQLFFDDADSIPIVKKTKKGERELDLKPLIYEFSIHQEEEMGMAFDLMVSTGSVDNIKPELVLATFFRSMGAEVSEQAFFIHRRDMFTTIEGQFVSLGEVGHDL
jgi:radical SAM-linked protein